MRTRGVFGGSRGFGGYVERDFPKLEVFGVCIGGPPIRGKAGVKDESSSRYGEGLATLKRCIDFA